MIAKTMLGLYLTSALAALAVLPVDGAARIAVMAPWSWPACAAVRVLARLLGLDRASASAIRDREHEARRAERTRIAQELHDTLLQEVISASMQLHIAADLVPDDSAARPVIERAAALVRHAIDEGRSVVGDLRAVSADDSFDLAEAFANDEATAPSGGGATIRISVEGRPRRLHPSVCAHVYRIGREALLNARRHANARNIRLAIEYSSRRLRVTVCDDGRGIEQCDLESGRDGHWGLVGMRERAEQIGARLRIWSRSSAGTDVELIVPARTAYLREPRTR